MPGRNKILTGAAVAALGFGALVCWTPRPAEAVDFTVTTTHKDKNMSCVVKAEGTYWPTGECIYTLTAAATGATTAKALRKFTAEESEWDGSPIQFVSFQGNKWIRCAQTNDTWIIANLNRDDALTGCPTDDESEHESFALRNHLRSHQPATTVSIPDLAATAGSGWLSWLNPTPASETPTEVMFKVERGENHKPIVASTSLHDNLDVRFSWIDTKAVPPKSLV